MVLSPSAFLSVFSMDPLPVSSHTGSISGNSEAILANFSLPTSLALSNLNYATVLSTDAYVTYNFDCCQFHNLCPEAGITSVYRTKAGDLRVCHLDEVYTLEAFTELVGQASDKSVFKQVYLERCWR